MRRSFYARAKHRSIRILLAGAVSLATVTACSSGPAHDRSSPGTKYAAAKSQPVRDSYYPAYGNPDLDTLHYQLDLDWQPRSHRLSGTATIDFRVLGSRKDVAFDLGAPMAVSHVELDGHRAQVGHHEDKLTVTAPAKLASGSSHRVAISYAGTPRPVVPPAHRSDLKQAGFLTTRTGDAWTYQEPYGAFTWYPVNDQPDDKAYYDAKLTAHDGQTGVFNGQLTDTRHSGTSSTTEFHLDRPAASYLVTVAFGDYRHEQVRGPHDLPINYWYRAQDARVMPSIRKTPQMIAWLEQRLGRYPFASAGVVLVPGSFTAEETQSLVTVSPGTDSTYDSDNGLLESDLAHELGHQWFGDAVTPRGWKDLWLSETLTTYVQVLHDGEDNAAGWAGIRTLDSGYRTAGGPPAHYDATKFGASTVYFSGALVLHYLAQAYGQDRLMTALRGWPAQHRYGNAAADDFYTYMSKTLGPAAGPYLKKSLNSTAPASPLPRQP